MCKNPLKERILNIILDVLMFLLGLILLVFIYNNIQTKILGNDHSSFFGYSLFEVQTGSMKNEINIGDWIIVKYSDDIKLNDIVTFKKNNSFVTHRVVEVYKNTYVTKGDANNAKDEAISKNQIVGKVVKILPHFGLIKKTILNPIVLFMLLVVVSVINFDSNKKRFAKIFDILKKKKTNDTNSQMDQNTNDLEEELNPIKEIKIEEVEPLSTENDIETEEDNEIDGETDVLEHHSEEELDKTMFFRMVNVDESELDETYLKIAKTEVEDNKKETKKINALEETEEDEQSLIESNLEMLKERKKRFNSILDKSLYIKKLELNEIIDILNVDKKIKVNEATIKDQLLDLYIDAKYYNYSGNINTMYNGRNAIKLTREVLKEEAPKLAKKYKGTDLKYKDKVNKILNIFFVIIGLDHYNLMDMDIKAKRELYKNEIIKFLPEYSEQEDLVLSVNKILKVQKIHTGMIKQSLEKLETGMFELKFTEITHKKNLYGINLEHNITFSKTYSDYIVDKTYSEGVIAEDKIIILVSLLLSKLVKNMFSFNTKEKYIIYLPNTLYEKENKLNNIIEKLDDEFVKNSLIILVKEEDFKQNRKTIKKMMKLGFRFAISIEQEKELSEQEKKDLFLAKYIFVGKKKKASTEIYNSIPKELLENVIFDDILDKTGNYVGGE